MKDCRCVLAVTLLSSTPACSKSAPVDADASDRQGAIIMSGHEHTYHRTKTMTNTQTQTTAL